MMAIVPNVVTASATALR
uniref:Uncharacterized protein n=1 Tax=Arundo donax TaxID=35708 RepID=A0A0A8YEB5_ARUDO